MEEVAKLKNRLLYWRARAINAEQYLDMAINDLDQQEQECIEKCNRTCHTCPANHTSSRSPLINACMTFHGEPCPVPEDRAVYYNKKRINIIGLQPESVDEENERWDCVKSEVGG